MLDVGCWVLGVLLFAVSGRAADRPNILLCTADDASYAHFGANGDAAVHTPVFDRIAREGVRFTNSFCSSPSCTPSRAALLTGRPFFQLAESANLWSTLDKEKFAVYPSLLEAAGYTIGSQGKGWGPGDFKPGGYTRNPAGPGFKSFADFRKTVKPNQPWCFWFGSTDPHRPYDAGSGAKSGIDLAKIKVPPWLPGDPIVRSDIADYLAEIQRFDRDCGAILAQLEAMGELDNTFIVITSDNGMPFPRAKANLYDAGTHMPLAMRWPAKIKGGRVIEDFVSHCDLAPTFLDVAGVQAPTEMSGISLLPALVSDRSGIVDRSHDHVFIGGERHAWVRAGGLSYPARAIRTASFLFIENLAPDRWPAGDPKSPPESEIERIFGDIDAGPSKKFVLDHRDSDSKLFELACARRPAEELYDLQKDPDQLMNVASERDYAAAKDNLRHQLDAWRAAMHDPRLDKSGQEFEQYPYYGSFLPL